MQLVGTFTTFLLAQHAKCYIILMEFFAHGGDLAALRGATVVVVSPGRTCLLGG